MNKDTMRLNKDLAEMLGTVHDAELVKIKRIEKFDDLIKFFEEKRNAAENQIKNADQINEVGRKYGLKDSGKAAAYTNSARQDVEKYSLLVSVLHRIREQQ